jgi:branched-chain amino acid transport system ATP-binding protein
MLSVRNLAVRYGAVTAVRSLDLEVAPGEIVALIGANGAGKTSTVKAIAGLLPFAGDVVFDGRTLKPERAEQNVRDGLAIVLEGRGILGSMSVEENLLMGTYSRRDNGSVRKDIAEMMEKFPILGERRDSLASLLSGGEQQMLAIARALLSRPRLLILDEPSLGLAPKTSSFVFSLIAELRSQGLTILLVEQKARQTLKIAGKAYLMENGRVIRSGAASELAGDPVISEAFLGGHTAHAETRELASETAQ